MVLILAVLATPTPAPSPDVAAGPCGGVHTSLLAALNRPTIGFSPCVVKPRDVVAEFGYANQAGGNPVSIYPQGFLRYGATPNVEVDVVAPTGNFDSGFGMKYEAWHNNSAVFGIDFLYSLPTGSAGLTAGAPGETVNFDYGTSISSHFGAGTTIGVSNFAAQSLNGSIGRVTALLPSVVLTNQWSDRAQFYGEAYGITRTRPDGGTLFGIDGGLQYLLSPQFEVDAEIGRVVTDVSASHYIGMGIGVRF